jgi:hypothetical protein
MAARKKGKAMTVMNIGNLTWFTNNSRFTQPFVLDDPTRNVIVAGHIVSNQEISFKVKNMIVLGKILSEKAIFIKTEEDFFTTGTISGCSLEIKSRNLDNKVSSEAIERISALGIEIALMPAGGVIVSIPQIMSTPQT